MTRSGKDHRKDNVRGEDAAIVVAALRNNDRIVFGAEYFVDVLHERFSARAPRRALRHRVRRRVESAEWKYIHRFPDGPEELYDLQNDPGERRNVIGQPAQAALQGELRKRLDSFFDRYADPQYDLKGGGKSKVPLLSREEKG